MQRNLFTGLLWLVVASCSVAKKGSSNVGSSDVLERVPDYSNKSYWAAHAQKNDPSDSIPDPLKDEYRFDTSADVFFVHPTTLTDYSDQRWNGELNDSLLNNKTDNSTILYQASVFNEHPLYAPRYRQAHLRSYFTTDTAKAAEAFEIAYSDVKNAFLNYLQNINKGRPIIIASHSQGSTHAMRLLKEFFDGKDLHKQLVVAYVIGMKIPGDQFISIRMCKDSLSTGCVAGWRTFREGYLPEYVPGETGESMVTNPLTWTTDDTYAPRSLNRGGVLRNFHRVYPAVADAQIHNRVLWVRTLRFPGSFLLRMKNFHVADINLFYMNIRENIRARLRSYHKSKLSEN